jgi:hypothetical protein
MADTCLTQKSDMISLELDSTKESLTINVDNQGVGELIGYLEFVRKANDHIHLVIGIDLSDEVFEPGSTSIKFLTIRPLEK